MARGPRKHLKRLNAPSSWLLDKLGGTYAPRPSSGPHKLRESLPLTVFLRNRLKYALTNREVTLILQQRLIKVDGKVRTDETYPAGFMDVISIERSGEHFRLLYDVKGRFIIHRISEEEAKYKLCKVKKFQLGAKGIPYIVTHDGRTIRYPDPAIRVNDTIKLILPTKADGGFAAQKGKAGEGVKSVKAEPTPIVGATIEGFIPFATGAHVMCTGGRNMGRAGTIINRERHHGGFDIVHVRDKLGNEFSTRIGNVFIVGESLEKPWVSLPHGKGIRISIAEERDQRRRAREAAEHRGRA